jgi:flagellar basal body-associated protein FliL
MSAASLNITLYVLWVATAVALGVCAFRQQRRTFRGRSGRPYAEIIADYYRETERRGDLLSAWATQRALRIDRQERRWG